MYSGKIAVPPGGGGIVNEDKRIQDNWDLSLMVMQLPREYSRLLP
jgi:hypothetical protein